MKKYCIIGGDMRQVYLGEALIENGSFVTYHALEKCEDAVQDFSSLDIAVSKCDAVILPMPLTRDGKTLNTPLSDVTIPLDREFGKLLSRKRIYTSNREKLIELTGISEELIFDYSKDEALCIANAVLTAEGAIAAAVNAGPDALYSSRCLVSGFGRIGKALAKDLAALGADVFVSARKSSDIAWIKALGYSAVTIDDLSSHVSFDFIFNTVPFTIFTAEMLGRICGKNSVYIELASPPYGAIENSFSKLTAKRILASGIPGKTSARSAAKIIYETITKHPNE